MADWTTIPDVSLEPGKPIRSIDVLALRDNPVAIAEGAAGAPRIDDAALDSTATAAGTTWVVNRNAGASVGGVGTYAWAGLASATSTALSPGSTYAGSALRYAGMVAGDSVPFQISFGITALTGTWRCMGFASSAGNTVKATLFLRIS